MDSFRWVDYPSVSDSQRSCADPVNLYLEPLSVSRMVIFCAPLILVRAVFMVSPNLASFAADWSDLVDRMMLPCLL